MTLDRTFLTTSNALINYCSGLMKLTFENMIVDLNIFNLGKQLSNLSDQSLAVNLIQWLPNEYFKDEYIE